MDHTTEGERAALASVRRLLDDAEKEMALGRGCRGRALALIYQAAGELTGVASATATELERYRRDER